MANKSDYIDKAKARMNQIDADIINFRARVEEAGADARITYKKVLDDLRAKRADMNDQLHRLQDASTEAWDDISSGFEAAWTDVNASLKSAAERLS